MWDYWPVMKNRLNYLQQFFLFLKGDLKCAENMKINKQLKACWVDLQFLDVLKSRPHWQRYHGHNKEDLFCTSF